MLPGIEKGVAVAINQAAVKNVPETFEKMMHIGPKVCLTTANSPGFIGFHALIQVGSHPLGGRFGGAEIITADSLEAVMESPTNIRLNPLNIWQYTVWENADAHEKMHYENFNRIFELCSGCLEFVVDGPWEPDYEVVAANLPRLMGVTDVPQVLGQAFANQEPVPKVRLALKRLVALGNHKVIPEREKEFEEGVIATLNALYENAPGMIGWFVMKKQGQSGIGPLQLKPPYFWEMLQTLGANPPSKLETNFGEWGKDYEGPAQKHQGYPEYLVHMEWESPDALAFGLSLTAVNPTIRKIHDEGVMVHLAEIPPTYRVMAPMMEDMVFFH